MTKVPLHCWLVRVLECLVVVASVWALGVGMADWGEGQEALTVVAAAAAAGGVLGNYLDRLLCRSLDTVHIYLAGKSTRLDDPKADEIMARLAEIEALANKLLAMTPNLSNRPARSGKRRKPH